LDTSLKRRTHLGIELGLSVFTIGEYGSQGVRLIAISVV
jgi:hypothetical protein